MNSSALGIRESRTEWRRNSGNKGFSSRKRKNILSKIHLS